MTHLEACLRAAGFEFPASGRMGNIKGSTAMVESCPALGYVGQLVAEALENGLPDEFWQGMKLDD